MFPTTNRIGVYMALTTVCMLLTGSILLLKLPGTAAEALETLSVCFTKNVPEYKTDISFLRERVQKLTRSYPTEDLMRSVYANPNSVVGLNCHIIGHYIGGYAYKNSSSLEDTLSKCTNDCRSSCLHGALGEAVLSELGEVYAGDDIAHADSATLNQLGERYCSESTVLCHGIGHVLLIATQDYDDALEICDTFSNRRQSCYLGVFMEGANAIETSRSGRQFRQALKPTRLHAMRWKRNTNGHVT